MRRGLIEKTLREVWPATLIFAAGLLAAELLLASLLPTFHNEIAGIWLHLDFVRNILRALLGTELGDSLGPQVVTALPWVHPVVLALVWAQAITFCTRLPAGEVDRGTIDVLLGLPVSRWEVYRAETAVWLLSGVFLLAVALAGNVAGCVLARDASIPPASLLAAVLLNFFALYLAVGGIAWLLSSGSSRKGRAMGWAFAIVLLSFLWSFLAQFWEPARAFSFLSILTYYRPMVVLTDGSWPLADTAVLLSVGAAAWALGGEIFRRRDIHTL